MSSTQLVSHLVLCPGCGYSFWTTDSLEKIAAYGNHCIYDDGHEWTDNPDGSRSGVRVRDTTWHRWLVDSDAIDWIANPDTVQTEVVYP